MSLQSIFVLVIIFVLLGVAIGFFAIMKATQKTKTYKGGLSCTF